MKVEETEKPAAPPTTSAHSPTLDEYAAVVGQEEMDEIRRFAGLVKGRTVKMVNSTAVGGGVAEILNRAVPLLQEAGLPTKWDVITGGEAFFAVTKAFHNALHGAPFEPQKEWFDLFLATNEENRRRMTFDEDFVVIHDPQPAPLVSARKPGANHWIWRCHIDLSNPNRDVWNFLRPFVERYDCTLFSSPAFARELPVPQYLFYPTIDPLAEKNQDLDPDYIRSVLEKFGIDARRPILLQVSRFDRLKDPVGVVRAFRIVRRYFDCQLVLAGGSASDDPEGATVLNEVKDVVNADPDIHLLDLPPWSHREINALQRAATIVLQKSLKEGFGLTVTEALWKKKPVIASAVGGIPSQVIHKVTGMLTHSIEGAAYQVRMLLSNPDLAKRLGENGHYHVKENFLITQNLKRYLLLLRQLEANNRRAG